MLLLISTSFSSFEKINTQKLPSNVSLVTITSREKEVF
jgi:hypothetical protein